MNTTLTSTSKMSGFCMRGGIDIDEDHMKAFPDSEFYWGGGAKWAKAEIYKMFEGCGVDDRIADILDRWYNDKNTWLVICKRTEHCLDLLKVLRTGEKHERTTALPRM